MTKSICSRTVVSLKTERACHYYRRYSNSLFLCEFLNALAVQEIQLPNNAQIYKKSFYFCNSECSIIKVRLTQMVGLFSLTSKCCFRNLYKSTIRLFSPFLSTLIFEVVLTLNHNI